MQALESLNDSQVNDFLSGKTPLNLSMRLGDHMMLIQLQLSTVNPTTSTATTATTTPPAHASTSSSSSSSSTTGCQRLLPRRTSIFTKEEMALLSTHTLPQPSTSQSSSSNSSSSTSRQINNNSAAASSTVTTPIIRPISSRSKPRIMDLHNYSSTSTSSNNANTIDNNLPLTSVRSSASSPSSPTKEQEPPTDAQRDLSLISKEFENIQNIVNSFSPTKPQSPLPTIPQEQTPPNTPKPEQLITFPYRPLPTDTLEQSPIKSLSNLVSSPIQTTPIKSIPIASSFTTPASSSSALPSTSSTVTTDPISAKLTSCICKRLVGGGSDECNLTCKQHFQEPIASTSGSSNRSSSSTQSEPPSAVKPNVLHKTSNNAIVKSKHRHSSNCMFLRRSKSSDSIRSAATAAVAAATAAINAANAAAASSNTNDQNIANTEVPLAGTDTRALAEASRSLTQTLRKLSKEVFTNKIDVIEEGQRKASSNSSGAVIESMKNHGKGIYSGTFSGTLNPALQDRYGRPKRDISTVIHILNDLLSATPHYSRGARICFEPTGSTRSIKQVSYIIFFIITYYVELNINFWIIFVLGF